jgi:hypothetical protein
MCGLLFISIETLRGNNTAALHHLEACLKIVREAQTRTGMPSLEEQCLDATTHLFRDIIPMYARLDTQADLMLGQKRNQLESTRVLWDTSIKPVADDLLFLYFETTFEAVEGLYWLGNRINE